MKYYKMINDQLIVGVITTDNLRKVQPKHGIVVFAKEEDAQLAEYEGLYYRANWMRQLDYVGINYVLVKIISITEEEYNTLVEAIETHDEPIEEIIEPVVEEVPVNPEDEVTLEYVKEAKINQMSKICHDTIVNGVDVVLDDGLSHHFSLTVEDQIKIQALALKAQTGNEPLPWHEDNKPCQFYSASDIMTLYNAMEQMQVYHTTYFNSLKMYILSLDNIEDVGAVFYGMEIPVEYQSDVLKYLLAQ